MQYKTLLRYRNGQSSALPGDAGCWFVVFETWPSSQPPSVHSMRDGNDGTRWQGEVIVSLGQRKRNRNTLQTCHESGLLMMTHPPTLRSQPSSLSSRGP